MPEPFALTGYCMGVRLGLRIAAAHPERVAALAGFHGGGLVTDDPDSPHRSAGALRAELYFGHADEDANNTPEQMTALDAEPDAVTVRDENRAAQARPVEPPPRIESTPRTMPRFQTAPPRTRNKGLRSGTLLKRESSQNPAPTPAQLAHPRI